MTSLQRSAVLGLSGALLLFLTQSSSANGRIGTINVAAGSPGSSPTPAAPPPTPTPILPRINAGPVRVELQQIATGLNAPNDLTSVGDGRLFVLEQSGQIRIVKNGALLAAPFLDVAARTIASDERGLLGLAFHPGYNDPANPGFRKFYTYTSEAVAGAADFTVPNPAAFSHQSVVAEWQASASNPDLADAASRREVLRIDEPQSNHNGGELAFRPGEPYLYVSLGDGGASNDVGSGHTPGLGNGQDLTNVLGSILRIDPLNPALTPSTTDPASASGKYRVPASNPFIASNTTVHEIYAYGLRNPFRFSFDAPSGRLIVGDVGQGNVEEVDFVEAGKNYGWNRKEGSFLFNPANASITPDPSPDPVLTGPVLEYSHADGLAIIGGFVDRGTSVPALTGKYVFGDYIDPASGHGRLFYSDFTAGLIQEVQIGQPTRAFTGFLKGFGADESGDVYVLGDTGGVTSAGGTVYKIVPIAAQPTLLNLSTRLRVEIGDKVLIGGFIVTGSATEEVILRGIGPSLGTVGIPAADLLANPTLELRDSTGALVATNDNWMDGPQKDQIVSKGLPPNDSLESAILAELPPGNYTTILSGVNGGSGIGLVELYATDATAPANPVNISTRGFVQTGDDVMIGGFIIGGSANRNLAIRAIGPSLAAAGISDPLLDPLLELYDQNGALLEVNDDWKVNQTEVEATGLAPNDDRESVIVRALAPGNYTAIVRGANGLTGVALVEAYDIP